jgi:hypothetical protein
MTIAELKVAAPIMTEDMLLGLYEEYAVLARHADDEDIGRYRAKMQIVEDEVDKADRPHVDPVLARRPYYWRRLVN